MHVVGVEVGQHARRWEGGLVEPLRDKRRLGAPQRPHTAQLGAAVAPQRLDEHERRLRRRRVALQRLQRHAIAHAHRRAVYACRAVVRARPAAASSGARLAAAASNRRVRRRAAARCRRRA
eukprot:5409732-Prymnesium_polylepis.1